MTIVFKQVPDERDIVDAVAKQVIGKSKGRYYIGVSGFSVGKVEACVTGDYDDRNVYMYSGDITLEAVATVCERIGEVDTRWEDWEETVQFTIGMDIFESTEDEFNRAIKQGVELLEMEMSDRYKEKRFNQHGNIIRGAGYKESVILIGRESVTLLKQYGDLRIQTE